MTPKLTEPVLVRRLKDDLRKIRGGFPERRVEQIDVKDLPEDQPELKLATLLDDYREVRDQRLAGESKRVQASSGLLICGLQQRLLSSIEAFARTLRVHRKTVEKQWAAPSVPRTIPFDLSAHRMPMTTGLNSTLKNWSATTICASKRVSAAAMGRTVNGAALLYARERALLDRMTELAEGSRHLPDAPIKELARWIRANCFENGKWTNRRVLIFTEWEDTLRYLQTQIKRIVADDDPDEERVKI